MEYLKKWITPVRTNFYAVKSRDALANEILVVRVYNDAFEIETANYVPEDAQHISESEFFEQWLSAMEVFEKFLPKPF